MNLIIKLIRSLFTSRNDIYPVKYKQHEKAKKETTGRTHQVTDSCQYDEIINDYPTYHRQVVD